MPVEPRKIRGKWRTVEAGTNRVAVNTRTGKPIDGGKGWPNTPKGRATAERQSQHVNDSMREKFERQHGRI